VLIEEAIYRILKGDSAVTAVVAGKVFSGVAKQTATAPFVVYRAAPEGSRRIVEVLDGGCTLVQEDIDVFSVGRNYGEAAELDDSVEAALHEFTGTVVNDEASPSQSIGIQMILMGLPAHAHQYVDDTKVHEFISRFRCHFLDPRRLEN
jgi:hypothetical protein